MGSALQWGISGGPQDIPGLLQPQELPRAPPKEHKTNHPAGLLPQDSPVAEAASLEEQVTAGHRPHLARLLQPATAPGAVRALHGWPGTCSPWQPGQEPGAQPWSCGMSPGMSLLLAGVGGTAWQGTDCRGQSLCQGLCWGQGHPGQGLTLSRGLKAHHGLGIAGGQTQPLLGRVGTIPCPPHPTGAEP